MRHLPRGAIQQMTGRVHADYGGSVQVEFGWDEQVHHRADVGAAIVAGRAVEVARETPLDLLLVETDCPFLAPVPHRGRRSEPAHVRLVVEKIARVRGESPGSVAAQTARNAERLFLLPA